MTVEVIYPKVIKKRITIQSIRMVAAYVLIITAVICLIINVATGGYPWSLIIAYAHWLFWISVITGRMFENTHSNRISQITLHACFLLYIINSIYSLNFARFVISLIYVCLLILLAVDFFRDLRKHSLNLMPITKIIFKTIIVMIGCAFGLVSMNWPLIVLGSVAFVLCILGSICFRRAILYEWKKRFH